MWVGSYLHACTEREGRREGRREGGKEREYGEGGVYDVVLDRVMAKGLGELCWMECCSGFWGLVDGWMDGCVEVWLVLRCAALRCAALLCSTVTGRVAVPVL